MIFLTVHCVHYVHVHCSIYNMCNMYGNWCIHVHVHTNIQVHVSVLGRLGVPKVIKGIQLLFPRVLGRKAQLMCALFNLVQCYGH